MIEIVLTQCTNSVNDLQGLYASSKRKDCVFLKLWCTMYIWIISNKSGKIQRGEEEWSTKYVGYLLVYEANIPPNVYKWMD